VIFTLLVEGIVVFIYSVALKRPAGGLLRASFIVNVFTQVMLWITLNLFFRYYLATLAIAEVVIWLVESVLLVRLSNEQLSLRSAIFLSFCMNLASFGVGWFLPI
jgi:uncharacterized membrane protein